MEDLIIRYPPYLREYEEIQEISRLLSPVYRKLYEDVARVGGDRFPSTMSLPAIERWESILGIIPFAADTLDDRRFRIDARINEHIPFTEKWLKLKLEQFVGADGYLMDLDTSERVLHIKLTVDNKSHYNTVEDFLQRIVPADVIIILEQLYNTYGDIENSGMTYGELESYTYQQIREDPIF